MSDTRVHIDKRAVRRRHRDSIPDRLFAKLDQLPQALGQVQLGDDVSTLDIKALEGYHGTYRLRHGDWRAVFRPAGSIYVLAIGPRSDVYERLPRMRIVRAGSGLKVIEPQPREAEGRSHPVRPVLRRRAPQLTEQPNPFAPFARTELRAIDGVSDALIDVLRRLPPDVDPAAEIERLELDSDLAALLVDIWERPSQYVEQLREEGRLPEPADAVIADDELAERLSDPATGANAVGVASERQIRAVLAGPIEDWMVFLHPEQRELARRSFNGPARVRGGAGTGKTVVALHRARTLAGGRVDSLPDPGPRSVLLTTFLRTLPDVWQHLLETLDPHALPQLDIRNIDKLAMSIVGEAHRSGRIQMAPEEKRDAIAAKLLSRHELERRLDRSSRVLLDEFDHVITGRGLKTLEAYRAATRVGRGTPLPQADRDRVWAAYEDYRRELRRTGQTDWHLLRLEALDALRAGRVERSYDAVVVDEAQDLTETSIRLLLELDTSPDHCNLMIIGDGRQAIYPGGFSMGALGIDIRGRSRVLRINWRNTWWIWAVGQSVIADERFDDLEDDPEADATSHDARPILQGDPVELHICGDPGEETEWLAELVKDRVASGVDPGDIAVLTDTATRADEARQSIERTNVRVERLERYDGRHSDGVLVGTYHRAKGLEFKEVFAYRLGEKHWPSRGLVPPDLPAEERDARRRLQLRALHVGLTRARERLFLLSTGEPAEPIKHAEDLLEVLDTRPAAAA